MDAGGVFRSPDGYSSSIHLDLQERIPWREADQPTKFFSVLSPHPLLALGDIVGMLIMQLRIFFPWGPKTK